MSQMLCVMFHFTRKTKKNNEEIDIFYIFAA